MAEVENIKSALKRAESNKVITFPVKIMDITSLEQGDIMNVKEKVGNFYLYPLLNQF